MAYSSNLSDAEWQVLEPVLKAALPLKKQTRPSKWTKRELLDGMLYQGHLEQLPKEGLIMRLGEKTKPYICG